MAVSFLTGVSTSVLSPLQPVPHTRPRELLTQVTDHASFYRLKFYSFPGLPWCFSDYDSELSLLRAQVQSLVRKQILQAVTV